MTQEEHTPEARQNGGPPIAAEHRRRLNAARYNGSAAGIPGHFLSKGWVSGALAALLLVGIGGGCVALVMVSGGDASEGPTAAAVAPTETPHPTPIPTFPPAVPTPTATPTATPRPTPVPTVPPRVTRRATQDDTGSTEGVTPSPVAVDLGALRVLMLELINDKREQAGAGRVSMGTNGAAQAHANAALEGCFTGHWGLDGTTPGMRYALAGGQQVNAENVSGIHYCIQPQDGFDDLSNLEWQVRAAMRGFMSSPGHRATILRELFRKVNIGISWDAYNFVVVQQFEGEYVRFEETPSVEAGSLPLRGTTVNGANLGARGDAFTVDIYHHPLGPLTRGQLARAYCLDTGTLVATLLPPPPGSHYNNLGGQFKPVRRCASPYAASPETEGPVSYREAQALFETVRHSAHQVGVSPVDYVVAAYWNVGNDSFQVAANIDRVLHDKGPGVYLVVLWGVVDGTPKAMASYPVFHQVDIPEGYGSER